MVIIYNQFVFSVCAWVPILLKERQIQFIVDFMYLLSTVLNLHFSTVCNTFRSRCCHAAMQSRNIAHCAISKLIFNCKWFVCAQFWYIFLCFFMCFHFPRSLCGKCCCDVARCVPNDCQHVYFGVAHNKKPNSKLKQAWKYKQLACICGDTMPKYKIQEKEKKTNSDSKNFFSTNNWYFAAGYPMMVFVFLKTSPFYHFQFSIILYFYFLIWNLERTLL